MFNEYLFGPRLHFAADTQHWTRRQDLSSPGAYVQGAGDTDSKQINNKQ